MELCIVRHAWGGLRVEMLCLVMLDFVRLPRRVPAQSQVIRKER